MGEERGGKQRGLQHHQQYLEREQHQQMERSRQHLQRGHQPTYMWDLLMGEEEGGASLVPSQEVCFVDVCRGGGHADNNPINVVPSRDHDLAGGRERGEAERPAAPPTTPADGEEPPAPAEKPPANLHVGPADGGGRGGAAWSPPKRYALLMYLGEGGILLITQLTWSHTGTMNLLGEVELGAADLVEGARGAGHQEGPGRHQRNRRGRGACSQGRRGSTVSWTT